MSTRHNEKMIKKILVILSVAGILAVLAMPSLADVEYVKNGSFTEANSRSAKEWISVYGGYGMSSDQTYAGKKSLLIDGGTNELGIAGALQIIRGFKKGTVLKITSRIYIEEFSSGIIKPIHMGFKSGGKLFYPHVNLVYIDGSGKYKKNKWETYELTLDLSDYPDVEEINVYCLSWAYGKKPFKGKVYFSDVSIRDISKVLIKEKAMKKQIEALDRPVFYASLTATPPTLDGKLDDACWDGCLLYDGFQLTGSDAAPRDQTEVKICHDGEYIYMAVKAYASALNPVNNLLHLFRDNVKERKGAVHGDDSIEFFFSHDAMSGYYQIIGNVHTTWERHVSASGGSDTSWNPNVRLGGSKHISSSNQDEEAFYIVEIAFSLQSLGIDYPTVDRLRINVGHTDKANCQDSHLSGLSSYHLYKDYPLLVLGDRAVSGTMGKKLESVSNGFALDYAIHSSSSKSAVRVFAELRPSADSIEVVSTPVGGEPGRLRVKTDERNFTYSTGLYDGEKVIRRFQSETQGRGVFTGSAELQAVSEKKIKVTVNGELVTPPVSGDRYVLWLADGENQLVVKVKGPVELNLPWEVEPGSWKVEGTDTSVPGGGVLTFDSYPVTLSRTILNGHSRTYPLIDEGDPLQAPLGTPQPFNIIINGVENQTLSGYQLYFEVPESLEFIGVSGHNKVRTGRDTCTWVKVDDIERNGVRYARYRIPHSGNSKEVTGAVTHTTSKKLNWFDNMVTMVVLPRIGVAQTDEVYPCTYYASAEDGTVVELPRKLPVKVLSALSGLGPQKMLSMTWFSYRRLDDEKLKAMIYRSHAAAGFNTAQLRKVDIGLIKGTGLKSEIMFNMTGDRFVPKATCLQFGIQFISANGNPVNYRIPFSYFASHPEVRAAFQVELEAFLLKYKPDVMEWDYEFHPLTGLYASYDAYTLADFRRYYAIEGELNQTIIAERYRKQWIEYMNRNLADTFEAIHEVTRKVGVGWAYYSAYPGEYTRDHYGMDVPQVLPHVDYAMMGYSRPLNAMAEVKRLSAELDNKPVIFGLCAKPYFLHQIGYQRNITPALVCRRLVDCGYGLMYWGHYASDGRLLHAYNEINRLLHTYELFFTDGKNVDAPLDILGGFGRNDIAAYELDDRLLLLFLNNGEESMTASFEMTNRKKYGNVSDFYDGRTFDPSAIMKLSIPTGGVAALEFRP